MACPYQHHPVRVLGMCADGAVRKRADDDTLLVTRETSEPSRNQSIIKVNRASGESGGNSHHCAGRFMGVCYCYHHISEDGPKLCGAISKDEGSGAWISEARKPEEPEAKAADAASPHAASPQASSASWYKSLTRLCIPLLSSSKKQQSQPRPLFCPLQQCVAKLYPS
jgi:hypothetical protein